MLCFTAPEIEGRLRQVGPGRGRAQAGEVAGGTPVFALAEGLPDGTRKVQALQAASATHVVAHNTRCGTHTAMTVLSTASLCS